MRCSSVCARQAPCARALRPPSCAHRQHRRCERRWVVSAAGGEEDEAQAQAAVMQQVEGSARMIEDLMTEILRERFLNAAVDKVSEGTQPAPSNEEVVAAVVGPRLEQLDGTFLATLDGYIAGAQDKGATDVAEVLLLVRDEVLRRLGQRLPPEMQLLEAALAAPGSKERLALLRKHALLSTDALPADQAAAAAQPSSSGGGSGTSLYCQAADLERAASQVIQDMELMLAVPDRRLLAKLVLLREELHQLILESTFVQGGAAEGSPEAEAMQLPFRQLGAIPRSDAIFLQRLMALGGASERRALLERALAEDTERLPATSTSGDPPPTNLEKLRAEAERPQEWVRPGRFMQSLNALQAEMLEGGEGGAAAPSGAVLERLESVRREALSVLLDMAGEGQPYLP